MENEKFEAVLLEIIRPLIKIADSELEPMNATFRIKEFQSGKLNIYQIQLSVVSDTKLWCDEDEVKVFESTKKTE